MRTILAAAVSMALGAQAIIPVPVKVSPREGRFTLDSSTRIVSAGAGLPVAEFLARALRPATGLPLPIASKPGKSSVVLILDSDCGLGAEGYRLEAGPDRVTLRAAQPAGLFYGAQTLRQMLPAEIFRSAKVEGATWSIPAALIEDCPRFSWRGSHLDASRHFKTKATILRHLDLMALHKLNVFHWHLTDDQGWRLEIKKYPRLTEIGAWRRETLIGNSLRYDRPDLMRFDNTPHGGFYTQDDVREVVAYAAERFITVVPEIEMPGHAQAVLAAYPEFGNFPEEKHPVLTYWGVSEAIFSPEDRTIAFLKDVLDEVMTLFPSTFIHVGGDECPKAEWARSPRALARMKELGLVPAETTQADLATTPVHPALHQLQSWFIHQMDAHLTSKNRRLIGWDEILEGGLAPGAAIMSWRGEAGGLTAATAGHDVVMTPENWTYLDRYQSAGPEPFAMDARIVDLAKVYGYEPVPAALDALKAKHVLGSQGLLWTEYVPTTSHMEYMLWPRLAAMAEVLWSPREARDFPGFQKRLKAHETRLKVLDVNFRPSPSPAPPR